MPEPIKGSCLCGRIAFEIDGKIGPIGQCHCSKCRKLSGTDGNAVFYTAVQSFRWLSGENDVGSFTVPGGAGRSEERSVGKECVRTGSSRGSADHEKKKVATHK